MKPRRVASFDSGLRSQTGPRRRRTGLKSPPWCQENPPHGEAGEPDDAAPNDAGATTVWVITFTLVFALVIGILVDVGSMVTRKQEISRSAAEAARVGIDELGKSSYRQAGPPSPGAVAVAQQQACDWAVAREQQSRCQAAWDGETLTITLEVDFAPQFPALVGVIQDRISAQGRARAELGI